jgi:hypothetical protein
MKAMMRKTNGRMKAKMRACSTFEADWGLIRRTLISRRVRTSRKTFRLEQKLRRRERGCPFARRADLARRANASPASSLGTMRIRMKRLRRGQDLRVKWSLNRRQRRPISEMELDTA